MSKQGLYLLSDPRIGNQTKIGHHSGDLSALNDRYRTSLPSHQIQYLFQEVDAMRIEKEILEEFKEYRYSHQSGKDSEWISVSYQIILSEIFKKIINCNYGLSQGEKFVILGFNIQKEGESLIFHATETSFSRKPENSVSETPTIVKEFERNFDDVFEITENSKDLLFGGDLKNDTKYGPGLHSLVQEQFPLLKNLTQYLKGFVDQGMIEKKQYLKKDRPFVKGKQVYTGIRVTDSYREKYDSIFRFENGLGGRLSKQRLDFVLI